MDWYWWLLLIASVIGLIYTIGYSIHRKIRQDWLSGWHVGDKVSIKWEQALGNGTYSTKYEDAEIIKWDLDECQVRITASNLNNSRVGNHYYVPIGNVDENSTLTERKRQHDMDMFMTGHSNVANERDEKLEEILK